MILIREKFRFFNIPSKGNDIYSNPSTKYNNNLMNLYHHALMSVVRNDNISLIEHISNLGGNFLFSIGSRQSDRGITPLHTATAGIAKQLLQLGFPVNSIENTKDMFDENKETPLDHAIQCNDMAKATILIRNGGISISPKTEQTE